MKYSSDYQQAFCNHRLINMSYVVHVQREDVKTAPSIDSLDLGFPEDDEDQSDGLCLLIIFLGLNIFIYLNEFVMFM